MKLLHLRRRTGVLDEMNFEFKQPATKMSSEITFFFKNLLTKSCQGILLILVNSYCRYIFKGFNYRFRGLFLKTSISRTAILTQTSVITVFLNIIFTFFSYWFYIFHLYNLLLISAQFLYFDNQVFKESKTAKKAESFCLSIKKLFTQMIHPLEFWLVCCCHACFFSTRFINMLMSRATFYLVQQTSPCRSDYLEERQPSYWAGRRW